MTIVKARIEINIPRKRKGSVAGHEKGLEKFFENTLRAIQQHITLDVIKCVLIASPGFIKDQFYDYMKRDMQRKDLKILQNNINKFLLVHSSSGHKHALKEVLATPEIASQLADTKAAAEVRAINEFYDMMKKESGRASYGITHVLHAKEQNAIQTLLVTDELFRACNIARRKQYVTLVEEVRENGGEVRIFSSLHVSGEQLQQLGGIAAILRFPLPELDDILNEEEDPNEDLQDQN